MVSDLRIIECGFILKKIFRLEQLIIYEKIKDGSLPDNYFYALIPQLGLTTHGIGVEGAKTAAEDLIDLWNDEKEKLLKA